MNKQEQLAEQIANILYEANGHCGGAAQVTAAVVEAMGVQQPTHYHVADNSNGFRDWLDKKKIEWMPNGHFTTIQLEGNDIFKLGAEFGLYRKEAIAAPAKAVEAMAKKGMKWVKASERNPDKSGYYFTYGGHFKSYRQTTYWYADEKKWSSETFEWLDESASSSNEDYVASNSNTDDTSLASHSCASCNPIEQETSGKPLTECMAGRDTECNHPKCPVTDEDVANGRYCTLPLYDWRK
jgi:hypothetical protein